MLQRVQPAEIEAMMHFAADKFGMVDVLVNNAAAFLFKDVVETTDADWRRTLDVNVIGYANTMRAAVRGMRARGRGGAIVNVIADMWMGMPGMGHSGAARAGMLNFTETAALEWGPVRSNAVAPGWIASSGMDNYPPEMTAMIQNMHKLVPLQRIGTESEVAAAIVFLLSPAAAFISGACLRIDGGAPNAKRIWPQVGTGGSNQAFNGFHLAQTPQVLSKGKP